VWPGLFPAKRVPKAGLRELWLEGSQCWQGRGGLAGVKSLAELNAAEVEGALASWDVLRGVCGWWKLAGDGSTSRAPRSYCAEATAKGLRCE